MNNAATQIKPFVLYRQQRAGRNIQALATGSEQDMLNRHTETPIGDGWFYSVRPLDHDEAQRALAASDLDKLIRDQSVDGYRTVDGYIARRMYLGKPHKINGRWHTGTFPRGDYRAGSTVNGCDVIAPTGEIVTMLSRVNRDDIRTMINRHRNA
jgi:hypothetical protein